MESSDSDSDLDWQKQSTFNAVFVSLKKGTEISEKAICTKLLGYLKKGEGIDVKNEDGNTILHIAVKKGLKKVVEFLLKNRARADIQNNQGDTARALAEKCGQRDIAMIFDEPGSSNSVSSSSIRKRPAGTELKESISKLKLSLVNVNPSEPLAGTSRIQRFDNPEYNSGSVSSSSSGNRPADIELGQSVKRLRLTPANNGPLGTTSEKEQRQVQNGAVPQNVRWDTKENYDASGLKNSQHGVIYQLKHLMLILNLAWKMGYRFRLATEMDSAEKFDDFVFEYEDQTGRRVHRFVQLKHKQDDNKRITAGDLLADDKGEFSVKKYYISWHKIKNKKEFAGSGSSKNFILCTNIGLDLPGLRKKGITPKIVPEADDLLNITNIGHQPPRYKLQVDEASELWSKLKLASDVNNIDHKEISHFLNEFILAVNQPNEVELGRLIAHDFAAYNHFNLLNADFLKNSFQDKILDWFKMKRGVFLVREDAAKFFDDMNRELSALVTMGVNLAYPEKLKQHNIRFKHELGGLRKFLDNSHPSVNLILQVISFEQTLSTALRIYQAIEQRENYKKKDSFIFIELENLLLPEIMNQVFQAFQSSSSHHLLIVDFGLYSTTRDTGQFWHNVHENMKKLDEGRITGKRIIFIIPRKDVEVIRLEIAHETIYEKAGDIGIDQLTRSSQQKLLEKEVLKFQGRNRRISFAKLLGTGNFDNVAGEELKKYRQIIDQETLIKLFRDEEIGIGGAVEGLGDVVDYYIPRTIYRRVVIKASILKDPQLLDIFTISGVDEEILGSLLENLSWRDDNTIQEQCSYTTKYIILEKGSETGHFDLLCKQNPNHDIHWLKADSGKLIWIKSFGSIANLLEFKVESGDVDGGDRQGEISLTEDQVAQHNEQIMILSDTAGMGKSTVLTRLAQKIMENEPNLLVIRIDFTAHTDVLASEEGTRSFDSNNIEGAVDFLVDKLIPKFERGDVSVLKYLVTAQQKAALLFDGFDEISPNYEKTVTDLLLALAKLNVKKLLVTTRPHTSRALEKKLGIFSHSLQPFSSQNQIEFLTKFWWRTLPRPDETRERLQKRARQVLNLLAKSIDRSMIAFTGIPLQTRMVAEVISYDGSKLPETLNIIDLYKKFVDKKYSIFSTEKKRADDTNLAVKMGSMQERLMFGKMHQKLALDMLFDEDTVRDLLLTQPIGDGSAENWEKIIEDPHRTGIVTLDRVGTPRFIHRTFAEYFAATFLVQTLIDHSRNEHVRVFFIEEFFVEPQYQTTRAFVNCLLRKTDYAPGNETWHFDLIGYRDVEGMTLFHVAVIECNMEIGRFFLNTLKERDEDPFANINCPSKSGITPLHLIAESGDVNVAEYLLRNGANVEAHCKIGWTPLHKAVLCDNLNMVKYLLQRGANVEAIKSQENEAAARGNSQGENGLTTLHIAVTQNNLDLLKYSLEYGANIEARDENGWTALHRAAFVGKLDVLKHLLERRANIEALNKAVLTPLHLAASRGNLEVVKHLLENKANIEAVGGDGYTPLHVACFNSELDVVQYLLKNKANIEVQDENGRTPLQTAVEYGNLKIVQLLTENGANMNSMTKEGHTLLNLAHRNSKLEVVEFLR